MTRGLKLMHTSAWQVKLPFIGDTEDEWLFHSDNPDCPIENMSIRKSLMPERPEVLIITLVAAADGVAPVGRQVTEAIGMHG